MHKVALIILKGYREWTESLGPARERIIQKTQARLQARLWAVFTSIGALPHHFRYDISIALINNIGDRLVEKAIRKLREISPVDVEFCLGSGPTPYGAYRNCGMEGAGGWGEAVVSHLDVINSTYITKNNGPYQLYTDVISLLNLLSRRCRDVGCMPFYLGGDNIMLFLPNVEAIWRLLDGIETPLRVGVGVSKRPYRAFIKATEALDQLRARGAGGVLVAR